MYLSQLTAAESSRQLVCTHENMMVGCRISDLADEQIHYLIYISGEINSFVLCVFLAEVYWSILVSVNRCKDAWTAVENIKRSGRPGATIISETTQPRVPRSRKKTRRSTLYGRCAVPHCSCLFLARVFHKDSALLLRE